jgi:putative peptidoglycan binding protein
MQRLNTFEQGSRPWRDILRPTNDRERMMVSSIQLVLRLPQTGEMDRETVIKLRGMQKLFGLRVTGFLDEATWNKINEIRWVDDIAE